MTHDIIELRPTEPWPQLPAADGVPPIPERDRQLHAADRSLLLLREGRIDARLSCWWTGTPGVDGTPVGAIGHYAAADAEAGAALLSTACDLLVRQGPQVAVGPLDGNTWRRYRFIVERGDDPPFLLEPDNPDDWPQHWVAAGFGTLATYASAVNDSPGTLDPRTDVALQRLRDEGITIGPLDLQRGGSALERIYELSLDAFRDNFLYTPIGRDEFMAQYTAVMPHVRPELVLMASRGDTLVGFMFALPDLLQRMRGREVDTVILKTLAVHPSIRGFGLGGALLDLAQRSAHAIGFRRAIHALFHDSNVSGRISSRYARRIRRYALFSRRLIA
jgi:GNAT superfamily N-acetyltransferase